LVDACVIALAERFDLREVAALDRRDFMVAERSAADGTTGLTFGRVRRRRKSMF
jgi:hypothetical protein